MVDREPNEGLALLRIAAVDFVATLLLVGPIDLALHGGTPAKDLEQLSLTLFSTIFVPLVDVIRTAIRWQRTDGLAIRTAIRRSIKDQRLPPDADPDTWTRPLVDQQRTVRGAPWAFAAGIAAVLVVAAVTSRDGRLDPIVLAALAVELVALVVVLARAVDERLGERARVISELLLELDARAAPGGPVARVQLN